MGGGAVMWNALRVAGRGVAKGSHRGAPMPPAAGQSSMTTPRPASAAVSSQGVKAGEPMPRVVFDAAPSFQEANAATTKKAIDQAYLSNSGDKHEVSTEGSRVSVQSSNSELETKSCESELVPKHALQAFQFLSASSEAQTVVASLLSHPTVLNAVSQNSTLNDFLHSQDKVASFEPKKSDIKLEELPDSDDETSSRPRNGFLHGFNDLMQNMKRTVESKSYGSELVPKTVVASLLSDPTVWNAVLQNSTLNDFLHSQDKVARFELKESNIELEELLDSDYETSRPRIGFLHGFNAFKQNMTRTVAGLLRGASGYLLNVSEFLSPENMGSDGAEKPDAFFTDHPMGSDGAGKRDAFFTDHTTMKATLLKLALSVAMVILFKRV